MGIHWRRGVWRPLSQSFRVVLTTTLTLDLSGNLVTYDTFVIIRETLNWTTRVWCYVVALILAATKKAFVQREETCVTVSHVVVRKHGVRCPRTAPRKY